MLGVLTELAMLDTDCEGAWRTDGATEPGMGGGGAPGEGLTDRRCPGVGTAGFKPGVGILGLGLRAGGRFAGFGGGLGDEVPGVGGAGAPYAGAPPGAGGGGAPKVGAPPEVLTFPGRGGGAPPGIGGAPPGGGGGAPEDADALL